MFLILLEQGAQLMGFDNLFFQKEFAEFFLEPFLMGNEHLELWLGQQSQLHGSLAKGLQCWAVAEDMPHVRLVEQTKTPADFSQAWSFGALPDEGLDDGSPVDQAGIVEKVAKK